MSEEWLLRFPFEQKVPDRVHSRPSSETHVLMRGLASRRQSQTLDSSVLEPVLPLFV